MVSGGIAVGRSIQIKIGNVVSDDTSIGASQIAQHHDRQLVINITRNMSFEALPGAAMMEHLMTALASMNHAKPY